jgi:hypothetical protein
MASFSSSSGPAWANPDIPVPQSSQNTGDIGNDMLLEPYSTLEEPVLDTIMRDVRAVHAKLKVVMLPLDRTFAPLGYTGVEQNGAEQSHEQEVIGENQRKVIESLKDWDLWGPLFVCLSLSVLLSLKAPTNQASLVFAAVFCGVWFGSAIVTLNAQLLGANMSFFQTVCVLGYCVFPLTLSALVIGLLKLTWLKRWTWLDFILIIVGFLWATRASSVFIGQYIVREKRFLAVFPVFFFYTFLGWLILLF